MKSLVIDKYGATLWATTFNSLTEAYDASNTQDVFRIMHTDQYDIRRRDLYGIIDNTNGPAVVVPEFKVDKRGNDICIENIKSNQRSRFEGQCIVYFENNKKHRLDGPAVTMFSTNDEEETEIIEMVYINDIDFTGNTESLEYYMAIQEYENSKK